MIFLLICFIGHQLQVIFNRISILQICICANLAHFAQPANAHSSEPILIGGWRSRGQRWALIGRAVITSLTARQHQPAHCFTPTPGQDALCPHLIFVTFILISVSLIVVVVIIIMLNLKFKILTKPGFRISTKIQLHYHFKTSAAKY